MRKTYEVLQVQTSLEKAERRLAEAIELAKIQSNEKHSESSAAQKAVEDAMTEFKKAAMEEQKSEDLKLNNGLKTIYGYTPEFSSHSKIENDITEIDDDKKKLVASILGEKIIHKDEEPLLVDKSLLNEEFHDGYDSLNKIAAFNNALKLQSNQSPEESMLNESEDYEMKCFNEKNIFDGETYEADDIMPSNFYLDSFDDEAEQEVKPYDINEALILGDVIPPDIISEDLENPLENIEETIEPDEQIQEINRSEILEQAKQQAEEILENARSEAEKILQESQQRAQKIIDEKVEHTLAAASEKGFAEGFEKGQNEGFIAAENAVNEGMIQEAEAFRGELELSIQEFNESKNEILQNNINELTDLAINVAEKVIKISLKSSKDVVAKMIVAAAEDCRDKQWAKVYISHEDKAIAMNLEKDLIDALNQISANVKVVVMEDEPSGTCIIESPDQIVDASVGTQLDNIRQIASDNKI